MKLVILESRYAGDIDTHVRYARAALKDCLLRGEAPIASHLLYTQDGVLDDNDPAERRLGIDAGLAWRRVAEAAVFYVDHGWSKGMLEAKALYEREGFPFEERTLASEAEASYQRKIDQAWISGPDDWNRRYLVKLDELGLELSTVRHHDYQLMAPLPFPAADGGWDGDRWIIEKPGL